MADFKYFSKNGQILPITDAVIPISNIEYSYGFGVYENIKVRNGILYFVKQHVERLFRSADVIDLEHSFKDLQIKQYIQDLVSHVIPATCPQGLATHGRREAGIQSSMDPRVKPEDDNLSSFNLKILLIGGENPLLFIIPLKPHFPDRKLYSNGAKTTTFNYERLFPDAKSLNMLPSYIAYKKAKENSCYDALLIDSSKNIVEGTRTNFFTIRDNIIFTPPKEKILEGVTKTTVLYAAQKHGFELREADIPLSQINTYDGVFLTSTSAKIVPIRQIDDFVFPQIPEKLKELMNLYDNFLKESKGIFVNA